MNLAITFADWILKNGYYPYADEDTWIDMQNIFSGEFLYSTKELLNKFGTYTHDAHRFGYWLQMHSIPGEEGWLVGDEIRERSSAEMYRQFNPVVTRFETLKIQEIA